MKSGTKMKCSVSMQADLGKYHELVQHKKGFFHRKVTIANMFAWTKVCLYSTCGTIYVHVVSKCVYCNKVDMYHIFSIKCPGIYLLKHKLEYAQKN